MDIREKILQEICCVCVHKPLKVEKGMYNDSPDTHIGSNECWKGYEKDSGKYCLLATKCADQILALLSEGLELPSLSPSELSETIQHFPYWDINRSNKFIEELCGYVAKAALDKVKPWCAAREAQAVKESRRFTYCAYCGEEFPIDADGIPNAVSEHIHNCPKHPIQDYKAEIERLIRLKDEAVKQARAEVAQNFKDTLGLHENELGFCEISNHVPYSAVAHYTKSPSGVEE